MNGLLPAAVVVPLLCALPAMGKGAERMLRSLLIAAPLPALLLAAGSSVDEVLALPYLLFGALWSVDGLRRVFLLLTALLWTAAGIYAAGYMEAARLRRFHVFWCLTLAGNLGLILSTDIPSFYAFFALMTFASYGLVVHDGSRRARHAGRVYLVMALLGELLLLVGLLLGARAAGSLMLPDLPEAIARADSGALIAVLLWLGFGVKAGLPMLHFWLPLAHPVAPTPASAVLSGAMIKAGLLGWLLVLPFGEAVPYYWGLLVAGAGGLAALGAVAIGVCQREPKTLLAYSSISQMGLMTLLLGAALARPALAGDLVPVTALYAVHHGLAKAALFLSTGMKLPAGFARRVTVWLLIGLPAFSLAGLPFTGGAALKLLAKDALVASPWWNVLLTAGAVATTLLVLRFLLCLRMDAKPGVNPSRVTAGWLSCTLAGLLYAWWIPRVAAIWWPAVTGGVSPVPSWHDAWSLTWPLLAGGCAAALAFATRLHAPSVPAGDGIVPLASLAGRVRAVADSCIEWIRALANMPPWGARGAKWLQHLARTVDVGEAAARRQAGLLFLVVLMLLAGLATTSAP